MVTAMVPSCPFWTSTYLPVSTSQVFDNHHRKHGDISGVLSELEGSLAEKCDSDPVGVSVGAVVQLSGVTSGRSLVTGEIFKFNNQIEIIPCARIIIIE